MMFFFCVVKLTEKNEVQDNICVCKRSHARRLQSLPHIETHVVSRIRTLWLMHIKEKNFNLWRVKKKAAIPQATIVRMPLAQ